MRLLNPAAQKLLDTLEGLQIDQWGVSTIVPLPAVEDLAKVGPAPQHLVDFATGKSGDSIGVGDTTPYQLVNQRVKGVALVGVELEQERHLGACDRIDFDQPPSLLADVAVAVGSFGDEQPVLHTPLVALSDIDRLLLGVERGHIGQGASHHPAGGGVLRGLAHVDDGDAVVEFEPFEIDVIKEVPSRAVHLEEQQSVQAVGVLFGVGDEFFEGLALVLLARGLGDADEVDDRPAFLLSVSTQRLFLHFEREALAFLLTAGDAGQGGELLRAFKGDVGSDGVSTAA